MRAPGLLRALALPRLLVLITNVMEGKFSEVRIPDKPGAYSCLRIFMQHHNMQASHTWRKWPQKPPSRLPEGDLCTILHSNFYEKALFVKVDVATALWQTQLLSALRAMLLFALSGSSLFGSSVHMMRSVFSDY
jgi:hypothetical protein